MPLKQRCFIYTPPRYILLPDKPGFKATGARGLDALEYYRHIAPLERKVAHINFNDNLMNFQCLGSVDI